MVLFYLPFIFCIVDPRPTSLNCVGWTLKLLDLGSRMSRWKSLSPRVANGRIHTLSPYSISDNRCDADTPTSATCPRSTLGAPVSVTERLPHIIFTSPIACLFFLPTYPIFFLKPDLDDICSRSAVFGPKLGTRGMVQCRFSWG